MIPVVQLLYKIDQKLNKLASTEHQSIPLEDKILALNEAQIKLIKKKIDTNNNYQIGFDGFRKRYQDLQILVVPAQELTATKSTGVIGSYEISIASLPSKYMFPISAYAIANREDCKGRIIYVDDIVKHSDVATLLANDHYNPSFEWQATFAVISSGKVVVYTDDKFEIDKIGISYLRYPNKIDAAGYDNFDGSPSTDIDCELEDYLEDELIDLVVQDLALSTGNTNAAQASQVRIQSNE